MATTTLERFVGDASEQITDQLLVSGVATNFTGAGNPQLHVRPYASSTVTTITSVAWTQITTGQLAYTPNPADLIVTTAGLYAAWWYVPSMPDGEPLTGPTFYILVQDPSGLTGGNPVDMCTIQDVKEEFEPSMTTSIRDTKIQSSITAVSIAFNIELDRELTPQTNSQTRRFYLESYDLGYRVEFDHSDLRNLTGVILNPEQSAPVTLLGPGNTLTDSSSLADMNMEPLRPRTGTYARLHVSPFLPIFSVTALRLGRPMVDVTGDWGVWTTNQVPADIRKACALTVCSWIRQNPAAYAFADHDPGTLSPPAPATFGIPAGVLYRLAPYRRWAP